MPTKFQALSSSEQLRVNRFLTQGKSPDDPEFAALTIEVGERYQAQRPIHAAIMRWGPMAFSLFFAAFALLGIINGEIGYVILLALIVLGSIGNLMLNPASQPKNVARSVEASRQIVARMDSQENRLGTARQASVGPASSAT